MLKGADISEYQGNPDFTKIKTALDFLTIRASYGDGYTDKSFKRNQSEARRVGILHGFYHYAYPQYNSPQAEANWFLKTLSTILPGEELDLDFEESYSGDVVAWCKAFLDAISQATGGYKPLLYLNQFQIQHYNWKPIVDGGYGLWVASYDGNLNGLSFDTPWSEAAFKQFTSGGTIPGISGKVDLDIFWGDANGFLKYGYNPQTTQNPIPAPVTIQNFSSKDILTELAKRLGVG